MNSAVLEIINGNTRYSDLVDISYGQDGSIAMIQANTVKINELGNQAALLAQEKLASVGAQALDIPLGTLIGGQLLSGKGPIIHVKMLPVGSVSSEYKTEFESAGINQTRQKIFVVLNANVRIVTPTGSNTVEVSSEMPVSETIVVGNVPNTFVDTEGGNGILPLVPK
jgi:sporulation protein YunB